MSFFLCFVRTSHHLSGFKKKKKKIPNRSPQTLKFWDMSPLNITRNASSVLDPPRSSLSPACSVGSELTMVTGIRDPPVIGKCSFSKQDSVVCVRTVKKPSVC